ncbi:MAG TPA: hypothetical protein VHQ64_14990 [Pyrinomonadaceae bacterium]|nr:hypothetical protein [Pyrinomonadaceae bacterium]
MDRLSIILERSTDEEIDVNSRVRLSTLLFFTFIEHREPVLEKVLTSTRSAM